MPLPTLGTVDHLGDRNLIIYSNLISEKCCQDVWVFERSDTELHAPKIIFFLIPVSTVPGGQHCGV